MIVPLTVNAEQYKSTNKPIDKLAGMLIEMHKDYSAIVAVKINKIVNVIKQEQAKNREGFLDSKFDS